MALRDHSGTIALCTSLVLHGAISYYTLNRAANDLGKQRYWAALPTHGNVVRSPVFVDEPVAPAAPKLPEQPVPPEPTPAEPKPVKPKPLVPPPQQPEASPPAGQPDGLKPVPILPPELAPDPGMARPIPLDGFGEMTGDPDATSMHSLSGDRPMQAPKGEQDQPLIRREPSLRNGDPDGAKAEADPPKTAEEPMPPAPPKPSPAASPEPRAAPAPTPEPTKPTEAALPEPQPQQSPRTVEATLLAPGPGSGHAKEGEEHASPPPPPKPIEIALAPQVTMPPRTPEKVPDKAAAPVPNSQLTLSGPSAKTSQPPAGEVAPQSDSDSDAFAVNGSAEFRPGKVVARFGRAVKTVRPKLSLAGRTDLLSLWDAKVVVEVHADETGTVSDVRIVHSSGSNEIDQPVKLAMYQWWFEPPRDSAGRPKSSVMTWTIHFTVR